MKASVAACVLLASSSALAFAPGAHHARRAAFVGPSSSASVLFMSDDESPPAPPAPSPPPPSTGGALVPIKEETVEFTAGILGGVAGFAIGGPFLGAIGAAAANYVSKMDGDVTEAVQAISKSTIQVYNYLANLDNKYSVLKSAQSSLENSLDKLKAQDGVNPETVSKVENALKNTNAKIKEINDEYDLVGGATTALGVFGDLVEKAVKKAGELNEEYQLSAKAKESLSKAVDKAKEASKSVSA